MKKEQFLEKHGLTTMDYRNLVRYEEVRESGMNTYQYLEMMRNYNLNGGDRLASWIQSGTNYEEFRQLLDEEKGGLQNENKNK